MSLLCAFAPARAQVPETHQAPPRDPAPREISNILRGLAEQPADEESMPREVRENFIDKVRIADEREQRIVGLGELGNPHMPPGVLLEKSARDPERSQVDAAALRERLIRLVESGGDAEATGGGGGGFGPPEAKGPPGESPESGSPEKSVTRKALAWVSAALAGGLLVLLAFLVARRSG